MDLFESLDAGADRITVRPGRALRRLVPRDIFFEYPGRTDIAAAPPEVLLLPFVWNVAPMVWASGDKYIVDVLDERVVRALEAVRGALRDQYPEVPWSGAISAQATVTTAPRAEPHFRAAVLFSGGVDSTYSALTHAGAQTLLVSVWGADVGVADAARWAHLLAGAEKFARQLGAGHAVVRSNFRSGANYGRLNSLVPGINRWWMDVEFAMAMTALAAPVLYLEGISVIHLASGQKRAPDMLVRHASSPRLDNRIALGSARVHHDAPDVNRQEKIAAIVADGRPIDLRVCLQTNNRSRANCGQCPKCLRTIVGLVVAGADPRSYGFPTFSERLLDDLPRRFAAHSIHFHEPEAVMWKYIQQGLPPVDNDDAFAAWLRGMDFDAYLARQSKPARRARRLAKALAARVPRAQGALRSMHRLGRLKRLLP